MVKITIVDDNIEFLEFITKIVEQFYKLKQIEHKISVYDKAELILYDIDENINSDIYILDIEMPKMSGLEIARRIRSLKNRTYIIIVTSHVKFALEGYDIRAFQFIPKILNTLENKLIDTLEALQKELMIDNSYYKISLNSHYELIPYREIVYIYKESKNAIIVTSQQKKIAFRETLKNIYGKLSEDYFVFIDRAYIINVMHILKIRNSILTLKNGEEFEISRYHTVKVKNMLSKYWGQ